MKQLIIIVLSCLLFSCKDEVDGEGTNPKLNILEYTFDKEGGGIEVYSQIDYALQFWYEPAMYKVEDPEGDAPVEIKYGLDGGWYKVSYVTGYDYGWEKRILIEVEPNDTGKERVIPIRIFSFDFACNNMYKQAK